MNNKAIKYLLTCLTALLTTGIMAQQQRTVFPLSVSKNKRHLTDQSGRYFLYHGDTAWMLFLKFSREEALEYLSARKQQGFNVIQVQLTGFADFNKEAPVNRYGQRPFLSPDGMNKESTDFSRPNPKYFEHVEWVIRKADSIGLALSIAPLWAGCCGEGWAGKGKAMELNKASGNLKFGEYIGQRFAGYKNILWILGGDNDPAADKDNYRQLALGIKKYAPLQLITYHASSSHSSTDVMEQESWLDFSMVYTYFRGFNKAWTRDMPDVYEVSWKEYAKSPTRPFILGESTYEGEHDAWGSELQIRKQAYWALLGGATGHAYGSPVWRCDADWRRYMNLPGAASLKHFYTLFSSLKWEKLVPDTAGVIVISGNGDFAANDYTTTAMAGDRSFSVSYLPTAGTLKVDLSQLKGKTLLASWFDPSNGEQHKGVRMSDKKVQEFHPPPGEHDWVLVIKGSSFF